MDSQLIKRFFFVINLSEIAFKKKVNFCFVLIVRLRPRTGPVNNPHATVGRSYIKYFNIAV
jgi:hypothetical protein